jgi:hypothetical protein
MMIIGGALACAFAFLRGLLTGDTGRIDRSPDEERIDYTSSEGDGRSWRPRKSGTLYRPGVKTPNEAIGVGSSKVGRRETFEHRRAFGENQG